DRLAHRDDETASEFALRRHKRLSTNKVSAFTRESGSVVPCTILDISTSGLSVQTDVRPQIGEFVLMSGNVAGGTRLHENGIGLEFIAGGRDDETTRQAPR